MRKALALCGPIAVFAAIAAAQPAGVTRNVKETPLPVVKALTVAGTFAPLQAQARLGSGPIGGHEVSATVELSGPAPCTWGCGQYVNGQPAGGMLLKITSSNPSLVQTRGGTVLVPVGTTSHTFALATSGVAVRLR